jgi:hypothetical protein
MASLLTLAAGGISSWTAISFGASAFNSLAANSSVVASAAVANATNLDPFADISFVMTVGGTTVVGSSLSLFLLPLNQDGTTYGDGRTTSSGALSGVFPAGSYLAAVAGVQVGVTSGNTVVGTFRRVELPRADFLVAVGNGLTVALAASPAVTVKIQTTRLNLNG